MQAFFMPLNFWSVDLAHAHTQKHISSHCALASFDSVHLNLSNLCTSK